MKRITIFINLLFVFLEGISQEMLTPKTPILAYKIENYPIQKWEISKGNSPNVLEIPYATKGTKIFISDGVNSLKYIIKKDTKIDLKAKVGEELIDLQLVAVTPNVSFSKYYIKNNLGKVQVQIPKVSELVNVLMALHPHSSRDRNMFDADSEYYKQVQEYFAPYKNHPALDTIKKYITVPRLNREQMVYLFPLESYNYYYTLKMNAVAYEFDKKGKIRHRGEIKQVGADWNFDFDPMKDVAVFEDFAKKSDFLKFYKRNEPYYKELITTYNRLNPIEQMTEWLNDKFQFGYSSFMVFFSPLNKGAQATTSFEQGDFNQTFMFVCKVQDKGENPKMSELLSSWILFTEIDHNYVNPLSDRYLSTINEVFSQREKWAVGEVTDAYPDAYSVFNEYMTFSLFTLYASDYYPEEDLQKFLPNFEQMMQRTRGFVKFSDFNQALLQKYKNNKNISISDLYDFAFQWAKKQ